MPGNGWESSGCLHAWRIRNGIRRDSRGLGAQPHLPSLIVCVLIWKRLLNLSAPCLDEGCVVPVSWEDGLLYLRAPYWTGKHRSLSYPQSDGSHGKRLDFSKWGPAATLWPHTPLQTCPFPFSSPLWRNWSLEQVEGSQQVCPSHSHSRLWKTLQRAEWQPHMLHPWTDVQPGALRPTTTNPHRTTRDKACSHWSQLLPFRGSP